MGVFRLAGSFTWNEEVAGSSPVSYTMGGHVPRLAKNTCNVFGRVRFPYSSTADLLAKGLGRKIFILARFVGVMANITDCRSVAMSSILIRTANAAYALMAVYRSSKSEESVRITHAAQNAGWCKW